MTTLGTYLRGATYQSNPHVFLVCLGWMLMHLLEGRNVGHGSRCKPKRGSAYGYVMIGESKTK